MEALKQKFVQNHSYNKISLFLAEIIIWKLQRQTKALITKYSTNHKMLIVGLNLFILQWGSHQLPPNLPLLGCGVGAMSPTHCLGWFTRDHVLCHNKNRLKNYLNKTNIKFIFKIFHHLSLRCCLFIIYHFVDRLRAPIKIYTTRPKWKQQGCLLHIFQ